MHCSTMPIMAFHSLVYVDFTNAIYQYTILGKLCGQDILAADIYQR